MNNRAKEILEYLRNVYPDYVRSDAYDENSVTNVYDSVKAEELEALESEIRNSALQNVISTATLPWIEMWEDFLRITHDSTKTLSERRSRILSLLTSSTASFATLKSIVYALVWWDSNSVTFIEKFTESGHTANEVFDYEVVIDNAETTNKFWTDVLESILNEIHPKHCNVLITIIYKLLDAISIHESVDYAVHEVFAWSDWQSWDSGTDPMTWSVWG